MIKGRTKEDIVKHENKMRYIKNIISNSTLVGSECIRNIFHNKDFAYTLTKNDVNELLYWCNEGDMVTAEDIMNNKTRTMITVKTTNCPYCGQKLERTNKDKGNSTFYCYSCNLHINIKDGEYNTNNDKIEKPTDKENMKRSIDNCYKSGDNIFDYEHGKSTLRTLFNDIKFDKNKATTIYVRFEKNDETSFDCYSFDEFFDLWIDFCKENGINDPIKIIDFVYTYEVSSNWSL